MTKEEQAITVLRDGGLELPQVNAVSFNRKAFDEAVNTLAMGIARLTRYDDMLGFKDGSLMSAFDNKDGKQIVAMPLEEYDDMHKYIKKLETQLAEMNGPFYLSWSDLEFSYHTKTTIVKFQGNTYTLRFKDYGDFEYVELVDTSFNAIVFTANSNNQELVDTFDNMHLEVLSLD